MFLPMALCSIGLKRPYALVCTTENGLITSYKMFEDTTALLEAHSSN